MASGVDRDEEDYSDQADEEDYSDQADTDDADLSDNDDSDSDGRDRDQNYKILSEAHIRHLQEDEVIKLSNILSISTVESCILLCRYGWDATKLQDEWFTDEEKVRRTVGLPKNIPVVPETNLPITCTICFDTCPPSETSAAACGHRFCNACWGSYIAASVGDGPGCLSLRCPDPSCAVAVGRDTIDRRASDLDREKFGYYLARSYIEGRRNTKWCPSPGCDFAVEFEVGSPRFDVCCECGYRFCFNCAEEIHRPVDCETVSKWISKNKDESENTNWILANSKPCPKCKRPIEKNQGCMHMSCRPPCCHQFCWLCLKSLVEHGSICNGYREKGDIESEQRKKRAKMSIERYTHYYERWAANEVSRQKALTDLRKMRGETLGSLCECQGKTTSEVEFVIEAWEQIVSCRRSLKWSYAYGYYLPEDDYAQKRFFEYLQGQAEAGLERLHRCAENEIQVFLRGPPADREFDDFRAKLANLTTVTRNYFKNLVRALENGLTDVDRMTDDGPFRMILDDEYWQCGRCTYVNLVRDDECQMCEAVEGYWSCRRCTYRNLENIGLCVMCEMPR